MMAMAKKNAWVRLALIVTASAAITSGLEGQMGMRPEDGLAIAVGSRVGYDFEQDHWSIGGQARFSLPFLPSLQFSPSADTYLVDGPSEWQANFDVVLQVLPFAYVGGGLAVARDSLPTSAGPTTETGYNLFIGLTDPALRFPVRPFAELRRTEINVLVRPYRIVVGLDLSLVGQLYRRR